jgi:hypothetical protein
VSEQPVTIREHIRAAVLAARPVGRSMAPLAEAVVRSESSASAPQL